VTAQGPQPSPEYAAARRVLLDALEALGPQRAAVVLAGAQAIYARTGPTTLAISEHTTDGDLVLEPDALADIPVLGELMEAAGFELADLQGAPEPGIWQKPARIGDTEVLIPVDLIVPTGVAPAGGTRGARLGTHGKRAARKAVGLEAVLVDNDVMRIDALEPGDPRSAMVRVAGTAALLVAKTMSPRSWSDSSRTPAPGPPPSWRSSASKFCSEAGPALASPWPPAPCARRSQRSECEPSASPTPRSCAYRCRQEPHSLDKLKATRT
jgi:hypothetical protein